MRQALARVGGAMLIVALIASGLWLYARSWAPGRSNYPVQGVSVDSGSGAIDWGTLAAQGADFAYIRAARGQSGRDPAFARHWAAARTAGMRYGAALDFSLCRVASDQAAAFVTTVPRDNAALPPVIRLDFDPACPARPGRDTVLAELNTLINQIEGHTGKPALLNPSERFEIAYRIADDINRTLWLDDNFFPPDYASRRWVMWTASDMRHIDGIDGPVRWNVVTP